MHQERVWVCVCLSGCGGVCGWVGCGVCGVRGDYKTLLCCTVLVQDASYITLSEGIKSKFTSLH